MKRALNTDVVVGTAIFLIGFLIMFVWVPLDTETGIIEKIRSRREVGDAMAPTIAAALFSLAGLLLCLTAYGKKTAAKTNAAMVGHLAALLVIMVVALALMRWTGPLAVAVVGLFDGDLPTYRNLRDTAPWKYLGFLTGGTVLVFTLISYVEHRLAWRNLAIAVVASTILAALYDLPFDDLLLPPNGDV